MNSQQPLIIYDGVCHFCNGAVQFIIERDATSKFLFTPMQTDLAQLKIKEFCPDQMGIDTFVLIKDDRAYIWSTAALEILKELDTGWRWLRVLKYLPVGFRDWCYQHFARRRYQLFGRAERCILPDRKVRNRFVGIDEDYDD